LGCNQQRALFEQQMFFAMPHNATNPSIQLSDIFRLSKRFFMDVLSLILIPREKHANPTLYSLAAKIAM
jgi:hypothetical protein